MSGVYVTPNGTPSTCGDREEQKPLPRITERLCLTVGRAMRYAQHQDKAAFLGQRTDGLGSRLCGSSSGEVIGSADSFPDPTPGRRIIRIWGWGGTVE